jgi:hypothetical protein
VFLCNITLPLLCIYIDPAWRPINSDVRKINKLLSRIRDLGNIRVKVKKIKGETIFVTGRGGP